MLDGLGARFEQRSLSWERYLFREAQHVVDEETELELIGASLLKAIGFRYVGRRSM